MPQVPAPPMPRSGPQTAPISGPGPAAGALPFTALAEIAVGATARVDLCRVLPPHLKQGQLLAVKRLHPHIAEDPTFVNQFLDEVWMTAALKHPNVVEVAGWGNDDQGSYLAVELVQGVSLSRLMKTIFDTGEAFTERMVVYLGACITRGLGVAHALRAPNGELLNLVHRDLTPGNVLIGFNGEVKIADFGLAKAKQRLTKTLTGMRKGDATYMAPEAARVDTIDARADLFSFGVLLFELFSGRRPWLGKTDIDVVQLSLHEPPADLRELRPKIDRELVNVVNRCLEKDPAQRFQSAREVSDRFDEWLHVHGYQEGNEEALARFVRRNAMRQMRWFERAIAGEMLPQQVGRDLQPRVPTYTEQTQGGRLSRPDQDAPPAPGPRPAPARRKGEIPPPPPPGLLGPPGRPQPARGPTTPVDPRTLRAQAAVQQLKKLAPAVEPPRGRGRGRASGLDEADGDVTDVEMRVAAAAQGHGPPRITASDGDEEAGEEIPTLIQKGDASLMALRAEARQIDAGRSRAGRSPYVPAGLIVDEESDQRITEVKREEQRAGAGVVSILDPDSELPTAPLQAQARHRQMQSPAAGQRARPGATRPPAIPPSPDIPPRPFPAQQVKTVPGFAQHPLPPPPVLPSSGQQPDMSHGQAGSAASRPAESTVSTTAGSFEPGRASYHDDVQVIDRNVLRQQVLHTEEGIIAESDRLAIEAVRRTEEARAAQLRAERKTMAARQAADAARIAAEAVQMIRTVGIAAAAKRLDEAHAIEQSMAAGRAPGATDSRGGGANPFATATPYGSEPNSPSDTASLRASPSSFPEPMRAVTFSAGFPGVDAQRAMAITGAAAPASIPPPGPTSQMPPPMPPPMIGGYDLGRANMMPSVPPSMPSSMPMPPSSSPSSMPMSSNHSSPQFSTTKLQAPLIPVPPASFNPSAGASQDADAFRNQLKPSIFGMPSGLVVGIAVGAVLLVIVLALLVAR